MPDTYIGIERLSGLSQTTVRADLENPEIAAALRKALDVELPDPLSLQVAQGRRVLWMSPDELLVIAGEDDAEDVRGALRAGLQGFHHMILDVSDARGVVRLNGARVGEVLAKGAPCDHSENGFPPGTVRRTQLGGLAVAIWRLEDEKWEIACFASYLHHLQGWLAMAARTGAEVA